MNFDCVTTLFNGVYLPCDFWGGLLVNIVIITSIVFGLVFVFWFKPTYLDGSRAW